MTPAALIADLRARGVTLVADGGRLRYRPKSACSPADVEVLREQKKEILAALVQEQILDGSLLEFERRFEAIEVSVPWLAETLWFIPTAAHADLLVGEGVARGRIWTARELSDVAELDSAGIESIGRLRVAFGAEFISVEKAPEQHVVETPEPVAPRPCLACHRSRFWRSIHGTVVCSTCHPPAKPDLVAEWLDAP